MWWNAKGPAHIKRVVRSYSAYAAALLRERSAAAAASAAAGAGKAGDPPPTSLLPAQLLFGCGLLAVAMPFASGTRLATAEELASPGPVAAAVAVAVAWLARHDLAHADVRPPNVLVRAGGCSAGTAAVGAGGKRGRLESVKGELGVVLVDYDDMRVVPGLGARLAAGGGVDALDDAFDAGDGCGTTDVPIRAQAAGVWAELQTLLLLRV